MFTLLTLNCFGVPTPTTHARLKALGGALNVLDADVICLQEVQANPYRRLLLDMCTAAYPYHAYAPFIHAPKGGLLTLSRHPILDSRFVLYEERGLWYTPALADWILHKGVLISHIRLGEQPIVVMNTHLTANYSGDWSSGNRFAKHEWEQLQQLAGLVKMQAAEDLVVVAGDFNIPRGSWLADRFLAQSSLSDPLAGDLHPTFRPLPGMPARYAAAIDFNLYRTPPHLQDRFTTESQFQFSEKHRLANGRMAYLSDHLALELRLSWER